MARKRKQKSLLNFYKDSLTGSCPDDFSSSFTDLCRFLKNPVVDGLLLEGTEEELTEKFVFYKILQQENAWRPCVEYRILNEFFTNGNGLIDEDYLLSNHSMIHRLYHYKASELYYIYAKNVLRGRYSVDLELEIFKNYWKNHRTCSSIYKYAKYVVRGRLPVELEEGCREIKYVDFLIKKGLCVDDILVGNDFLCYYFYKYKMNLPEVAHNYMIGMKLCGNSAYAHNYFKIRKKDDKVLKSRLGVLDKTKTIQEVLDSL